MLLADDEETDWDGDLHALEAALEEKVEEELPVKEGECSIIELMGAGEDSRSELRTVKLEGLL